MLIAVSDTGVGMSPETLAKVFDPFFTTKPIGQGTGLGLSMIYGFAKQSRGQVRIDSVLGKGATISLYLPRHRGAPVSTAAVADRGELPQGSGETVLVIEDDPSVRLLIGEVLRELGYACLEAADGQVALPLITSNVRLDLMITDVGLPGLNGRQVAEIARQYRPDLRILFVTGYAEHATERGRFLGPGMQMITKPFALDALAVKIREMIVPAPMAQRGP
jgi:CheY-like chemotaxis protein